MSDKTVLSDDKIRELFRSVPQEDHTKEGWVARQRIAIGRAIEQAVLQSPEIQALRKDAEQLNWLLNNLRDFHAILFDGATPLLYRGRQLKSADALRGEISAAMEKQP